MFQFNGVIFNQVHLWFLKIDSMQMSVCVFVRTCVSPPSGLLITSGVIYVN